jgi:hypothetical protein
MKYEVRYLIDENEHMDVLEVESAAEAAARVQENHGGPDVTFELIQVQLIEEEADDATVEEPANARS